MGNSRRLQVMQEALFPAYVVWELTLKCDQRCTHCGSRAADARPHELTTEEALGVARQLAAMKAREVVLIGGEAYLHPGFLEVVRELSSAGVRATMTTGGRGVTPELATQMKQAGLQAVGVSVDGLGQTHDLMRATPGGFASTVAAMRAIKGAGLELMANTNLNRFNVDELEGLYEHFKSLGVRGWQVQLTAPLGRAADRPEMLLQPWDLVSVVPRVIALKERGFREGLLIMPGNNLGYFGPEEATLRSTNPEHRDHWQGCQAGRFVMGVESDGAVKGCPSLQTLHYVGGNVRERTLKDIWDHTPQLAFARERTVDDLWGFCRSCPFAETCKGGCTFTAHAILGRPGNNPYCHYRARTLKAQGRRERLQRIQAAPGTPFDNGLFEIVEEAWDAPDPAPEQRHHRLRVHPG